MDWHELLWIIIVYNAIIDYYGLFFGIYDQNNLDYYVILWIIFDYFLMIIDSCGLLLIIMDYFGLLWITMDNHGAK